MCIFSSSSSLMFLLLISFPIVQWAQFTSVVDSSGHVVIWLNNQLTCLRSLSIIHSSCEARIDQFARCRPFICASSFLISPLATRWVIVPDLWVECFFFMTLVLQETKTRVYCGVFSFISYSCFGSSTSLLRILPGIWPDRCVIIIHIAKEI